MSAFGKADIQTDENVVFRDSFRFISTHVLRKDRWYEEDGGGWPLLSEGKRGDR